MAMRRAGIVGAEDRPGWRRRHAVIGLVVLIVAAFPPLTANAHGGGCRKSSPPGQCCHMDNSSGTVHCH